MKKKLNYNELSRCKIFVSMKIEEMNELFSSIKYQLLNFEKGETIFFRDEEINGLYLILNGRLRAEMLNKNGNIYKIEELGKGDIIASAFIFGDKKEIPVDLIVLERTDIIFIEREDLLLGFQLSKSFLRNYLDEISNKAQFLSMKVWGNLNTRTIKEKLEEYIITHREGDLIVFDESIKELAERFMVSRPALSRVISEMVEQGELERVTRKKFKINNIKK